MALHATGWAGLLACYFVPSLRIWPFAIFCLFLIGYGLLHDRQLAMALNDKVYSWTMSLRCVLDELRKVQEHNGAGRIERVSVMEGSTKGNRFEG